MTRRTQTTHLTLNKAKHNNEFSSGLSQGFDELITNFDYHVKNISIFKSKILFFPIQT